MNEAKAPLPQGHKYGCKNNCTSIFIKIEVAANKAILALAAECTKIYTAKSCVDKNHNIGLLIH